MTARIDVVIVDYNAGAVLRDCLTSLALASRQGARLGRITVVDNASNPPTASAIGPTAANVRILRNDVNRGFAAACNQGALGSVASYVLFLNPDTVISKASIDVPAAYLDQPENTNVGIVGIQLLDEHLRVTASCFEFPRASHYWNSALGLSRLSPMRFPTGHMVHWDHCSTRAVDQVMGAFFMVRRQLFETLGGFDERFFVYFEEMDFSKRAAHAGYRTMFLASASAVHVGESTTRAIKARRLFYSWRSRLAYASKHLSAPSVASVGIVTMAVEPITRVALALRRGSVASVLDIARAGGWLWRDTLRRTPRQSSARR